MFGHNQHDILFDSGNGRTFTVLDPSGFPGYWRADVNGGRNTITLPEGCAATPTFRAVEAGGRLGFAVNDAAATARVDYVQQNGLIVKGGAGGLSVGHMEAGVDAKISLGSTSTGPLILDGHVPGETYAPPEDGLYLHLDASVPETLLTNVTTYAGKQWTSVTNWLDVRGNGLSAWPYWTERPPHVSDVTSPSGLPLVSLGAFKGNFVSGHSAATHPTVTNEALHGVNSTLRFAATSKIREVFAVWQEIEPSWSMAAVIGHTSSYNFHPGEGHKQIQGGSGKSWVMGGLGYFNGGRYDLQQSNDGNLGLTAKLFVLSIGTLANAEANLIGSDRNYRNGGVRYGEILVYTNQLSSAERSRINEYLNRKWRGPLLTCGTSDYGAILVNSALAEPTVCVPSNRVASVRRVRISSEKLVKEGAGRLEIGFVHPANATIEVRGGEVMLAGDSAAIPDSEPAGDPSLWLDASTAADMSITNAEDGTRCVTGWRDHRAGHPGYATNGFYNGSTWSATSGTPYPGAYVAETLNGMGGVRFGEGFMRVCDVATAAYSGFIVVRQDRTSGECPNFFGSSTAWTKRQYSDELLGSGYASGQTLGASWTIDGVPYDAIEKFTFGTSSFWVIGFTSQGAATLDFLAKDRTYCSWRGGITVCEYLAYTNRLSEAARRQNVAYLLKRWKNTAHPESAVTQAPNLSFASDLPVTIDFAADRSIEKVSGGNGTLVKRGAGAVSLTGMSHNEILTDLSVEEGSLAYGFGDESALHLDATSLESFQTAVVPGVDPATLELDGSLQTNVVRWYDVRGNGRYAATSRQGLSVTNPTLAVVATATDRMMRVVDFGKATASSGPLACAGLDVSAGAGSVREAYTVFRDRDAHVSFIFSDSSAYPYHRNEGGCLVSYSDATYAKYSHNGKARVDAGAPMAPSGTYVTDFGFHVLSAWTVNGGVPLRTIARDRNARAGGIVVGEYLLFSETNTTAYADYLQRALNWKWRGVGSEPVWTNTVSSLSVAAGATFSSTDANVTWSVSTLKGAGTVSGTDVLGVTALEPTGNLTVSGAVVAPGAVDVTYRGEISRTPGTYTILTAGSLDIDFTQWTLATPTMPHGRQAVLERDATHVYMRVVKSGMTLLIR